MKRYLTRSALVHGLLTDVDHYFTPREPCVASLRSDRHQIGMTDRPDWKCAPIAQIAETQ